MAASELAVVCMCVTACVQAWQSKCFGVFGAGDWPSIVLTEITRLILGGSLLDNKGMGQCLYKHRYVRVLWRVNGV